MKLPIYAAPTFECLFCGGLHGADAKDTSLVPSGGELIQLSVSTPGHFPYPLKDNRGRPRLIWACKPCLDKLPKGTYLGLDRQLKKEQDPLDP